MERLLLAQVSASVAQKDSELQLVADSLGDISNNCRSLVNQNEAWPFANPQILNRVASIGNAENAQLYPTAPTCLCKK
jgi:hypothetical protein